MRSKSSKAKMRRNRELHDFIKLIEIKLIDNRNGLRFYLLTVRLDKFNTAIPCVHHEIHGFQNVVKKYHQIVEIYRSSRKMQCA